MSTTILNGILPWMMRRSTRAQSNPIVAKRRSLPINEARWYRVKVDMDRLRSHLVPESRRKADEKSLRRWLRQSGFKPNGDWWLAPESALGQLAPSEVIESEVIDA